MVIVAHRPSPVLLICSGGRAGVKKSGPQSASVRWAATSAGGAAFDRALRGDGITEGRRIVG